MKKKIGILTFSQVKNFGAVLQAYALKKVLSDLGAQADCIDYRASFFAAITFKQKVLRLVKRVAKICLRWPVSNRYFNDFIAKYLTDTPPLLRKDLPALNNQYDLFVAGSDQIWNVSITHRDASFFLDFVQDPQKKSSYAASFGFDHIEPQDRDFYQSLLQRIPRISVRERSGAAIVKDLTGTEPPVVLDPTLLLTKQQWEAFTRPVARENYVLMYLASKNQAIVSFAQAFAASKNLPLIYISGRPWPGVESFLCPPEEFVEYFRKAKYVVTNSFHGLAFSINLNKEFIVDWLPPQWPANARLENLLDITDLRSRLLVNFKEKDTPIDWARVNAALEKEREKSLAFLRQLL